MRTAVMFVCAMMALSQSLFSAEQPNILFILSDDLGYADLSCYGSETISTPVLDQLAQQGVRLTNHYANGAECTPTRAAFLTGMYQNRIGGLECAIGIGNVGRYDDAVRLQHFDELGLPQSVTTLPELLLQQGYRTYISGKWHLGYGPRFSPNALGFEKALYCTGGGMDYFHFTDTVLDYNLFLDGKKLEREGYFTDMVVEEAISQLQQHPKEKPFFLYLPFTTPHAPYQERNDEHEQALPVDSIRWKQGRADPAVYKAMVEQMDEAIGRLLSYLEKQKLTENTIIVFTNDNGGTKSGNNGILRGHKGSTFEGGIKVPAIVKWDGHLPAGTEHSQLSLTMDWTKSFANIAGVPQARTAAFDGMDLIEQLKKPQSVDRTLYWRKQRGEQVWRALHEGDWKLVIEQKPNKRSEYLFNLSSDPSEKQNMAKANAEVFSQLKQKQQQWETEVRAERRGRPGWTPLTKVRDE